MVDLFLDHGAVNVVGAEAERHLRHPRRHHNPVSLDVREVVEQQPRHRDVLQVHEAGGLAPIDEFAELGVGGMEGERNKRLEAMRFILKLAELEEVVHAVNIGFDMAVKHGGVRVQSQLVSRAMDFEPGVGADLVVADDAPHRGGKNLRAAARQRPEAGLLEAFEDGADG